mgnify:FL=1
MEVKISAVILTLNEERDIERCITSLDGVADDVIVVDSFSTDKTEEMCARLGARFVKHAFEGYGAQKNWAVRQALHPVVLSLDADEALSEGLRESILEAKRRWSADAYSFNRLTNYCGKWIRHCGWYPDVKLRLWDTAKGEWSDDAVHERVRLKDGARSRHLSGDLLHFGFRTISEHVEQVNAFSEMKAAAKRAEGRRTNLGCVLAYPIARFVKGYVLKAGFLDGRHGLYVCAISAVSTFLTYAKLFELQREARNEK